MGVENLAKPAYIIGYKNTEKETIMDRRATLDISTVAPSIGKIVQSLAGKDTVSHDNDLSCLAPRGYSTSGR